MFAEFDSELSPDNAYKRIIKESSYGDFKVVSATKNEQVVLKGGRDYNKAVMAMLIAVCFLLILAALFIADMISLLLIIIGLIIVAVYYWTRPYQKIIIEIEPKKDGTGSLITISTEAKIQDSVAYEIRQLLRPPE